MSRRKSLKTVRRAVRHEIPKGDFNPKDDNDVMKYIRTFEQQNFLKPAPYQLGRRVYAG